MVYYISSYINISKISLHNERKDFMKSLRKALYLAITAAALTVSLCIGASAARLTDINGHWAKKYIEVVSRNEKFSTFESG